MKKLSLLAIPAMLTLSCALTSVSVYSVRPNIVRLGSVGNAFASMDSVFYDTLLKASKITIEAGFDYFAIIDENQQPIIYTTNVIQSNSRYTANFARNNVYGNVYTTTTVSPFSVQENRLMITIEMYRGQVPDDPVYYDPRYLLNSQNLQ